MATYAINSLKFDGSDTYSLTTLYGTCSDSASTAAKTVSTDDIFSLEAGARVTVTFTYANTASSPTLNVKGTGAKSIYYNGVALPADRYWPAGATVEFVYTGSVWNVLGVIKPGVYFLAKSLFTTTAGSSTSGSYLATKWSVANADGITTPYDGMVVAIRVPLAGTNGGVLLSINGGTTYYPVVRQANSNVTTHYPVNSTIILTFNSSLTASAYATAGTSTSYTGCWQIAEYDSNTTYSNASLGQGYGTCTTAKATTAKVVTLSSYSLVVGGVVVVKFTYDVPAGSTLNVNSKGAKSIYYQDVAIVDDVIKAGDTATFIYDGSVYRLLSLSGQISTLSSLSQAMVFRGTLGTSGTITALPTAADATIGDAYKVITAGTYASQAATIGDMFVCSKDLEWVLIPAGEDEQKGTVTQINTGACLTGGPITTAGTIAHEEIGTVGTTSSATISDDSTFTTIDSLTSDGYGHITGYNLKTVTLNDTKVTQAYSTTNANYPLLMSATSGISSTSSRGDNTSILNNNLYANPSTGSLYAKNLYLNAGNTDQFIYFQYSSTGYDWRIGYLGTGSGDANYLVIQSDGSEGTTWSDVVRFGLTSLDAAFGGNIYPLTAFGKNIGSTSNPWSNVYANGYYIYNTNKTNSGSLYVQTHGTASTQGESYLVVGNATASGSAGNSRGSIFLYSTSSGYTRLVPGTNNTSNYTLYLPGATGQLVYHANDTQVGSAALPVYVTAAGKITACTGSSLFSELKWTNGTSAGPTLSATIAGYTRTATIPSASASVSGAVTTGAQTFAGAKTFSGGVIVNGGGAASNTDAMDQGTGLIIRRGVADTEAVKITVDDDEVKFFYENDEVASNFKFVLYNTGTETSESSNTSIVTFNGSSSGSTVTATKFVGNLDGTATKATEDGSGDTITSTYLKLSGGTMTGALTTTDLTVQPSGSSAEGGQINLKAASSATTYAGSVIDNYQSTLRIFGIASADGTTKTGVGTPLVIDPYNKTITGGYTMTGSLSGNASTATKLATARTLQTNLASTTAASFDGSANASIGVTGTLPVANGGTGVSSHTANRLVWSTSSSSIQGGYHYADEDYVAINYTSKPSYNFYVSGTAGVSGATTLSSTLTVSGATTLNSTLAVSGATTLNSTLTVKGRANVAQGLCITQSDGTTGYGISLYGNTSTSLAPPDYGLFFAKTATYGIHGSVTGDWATYFTMNSGGTSRGWIFRRNGTANVASISGSGNLELNGSATVNNAVTIVYDSTNECLNFTFVA